MFSRYRSYTSYSEENGKLVPSIEPMEKNLMIKIKEAETETDKEKKLKSDQPTQIIIVNK